jgi:asparagine synthase (glutamine-hydrolysing)
MILGAVGCSVVPLPERDFSLRVGSEPGAGVASCAFRSALRYGAHNPRLALVADAGTGSWLAYSGNPMSVAKAGVLARGERLSAAQLLRDLAATGLARLREVEGQFAIAWWDARRGILTLIRDHFGIEPLCYAIQDRQLVFGSFGRDVAAAMPRPPGLSMQGLVEYLTHCYLPGDTTLFDGVMRVPGGSAVEFNAASGTRRVSSWYRLSFADPVPPNEADIAARYRELLEAAVVRRLNDDRTGVLLSGGMDSSSAVTFARRHMTGPISSFSFRCAGAGFDESGFARQLAAELGTQHTEVEYGEPEALAAVASVGAMDMPFCDIGIEIGTWLLSQAAGPRVDYLLTGDGGDEIWASHPVYAAQKIMRWYDRTPIPRPLRAALVRACSLVKDSDQKRNLAVVLKRILPEASYPDGLRHYRWRMYYTLGGLRSLLTPQLAANLGEVDPFAAVAESFSQYQGPDDGISACLYSDYRTVSSFYFSRLYLARSFGLEARLPFYDRDLVEFGARIPLHLKLEGIERTKRLFRVAMEGILPDIINHRRDKMGNSVPFKNWLRQDGPLSRLVRETLTGEEFLNRGLVRRESVVRLLDEHRQRRHNHSHRIWALFVLEQWFRKHFRSASAPMIIEAPRAA